MVDASDRLRAALAALQGHYPDEIELSLGRIRRLLEALGRPQDRLPPVIHVAGTNGKGSTCAFLRAMAEAAGLSVHVFTSPHLVRFNERIRLAGELIDDDTLGDVLERAKAALGSDQITHFEATTAAALLAFSEKPADLLVLEVGLGGRYDATNVIDTSAVAVICPVDYDHKQFLGDDLAGIAAEKSGIIRRGCPVVSAVQSPVAARVIADEARTLGAPLHVLQPQDLERFERPLALAGSHQKANAALAARALKLWGHPAVTDAAIASGANTASWPARMQRLGEGPVTAMAGGAQVWLDGGHNPHAARAVAALLAQMPGRTVLVCAMMASKDAVGFFSAFAPLGVEVITAPNAEGHAGRDPDDLADAARQAGLQARAYDGFRAAMTAAAATGAARILICGSLYLAGDVLAANLELPK